MSFKEWLKEREQPFRLKQTIEKEHIYYTYKQLLEDIESFDKVQQMLRAHSLGIDAKFGTNFMQQSIILDENIIEPYKIKINTTNIEELNKEFNIHDIYFEEGSELNGVYKQELDEIHIFISKSDKINEIEAMIAHEMIHKEQNKRSKGNYFKKVQKDIDVINKLYKDKDKLIKEPGGILVHRDKIKILDQEIRKKTLEFTHFNQFEEMAYACQAVKTYVKTHKNLNDIIDELLFRKFPITSTFKKYLYMYWLIKDKI